MLAIPARQQVAIEHTWALESVFADEAAWEAEVQAVAAQLPLLAQFRGRLGESPAMLLRWFLAWEPIQHSLGRITVYASNGYAADTTDQAAAARNTRAETLRAQALAASAFAEPEITAIGCDALRIWVRQEPGLAIYAHYFDTLEARRAHVRSVEVEELLGLVTAPFRTAAATHGILTDADLTCVPARSGAPDAAPLPIAQGNIGALLASPDREVRRTAWENYADAHLAFKNSMANCLAAGVQQDVFTARARRYASALEAALGSNHVPVQVYHNVIETFQRNLPVWHRYWRVRRQALGYARLHVYDIKAPLILHSPQVSYRQAVDWICDGLGILGADYVQVARRGLVQERWVDIYPNRGKRAGAFSEGAPGTRPFILMSYNDDLYSLSTLAHELGHSMHSYLAWQTQPWVYRHYSILVAEVASNLNQALVRQYLFDQHHEREFQIALCEEALSNMHRYLFLMPTLARFEIEIHQRVERGQALTADGMTGLLADLFREGYGDEVVCDTDRCGITWAQFATHLYANFYVYQYTTGIAAAHDVAERLLAGESGAPERTLAFLRAGASVYPLDAVKLAGVDLTTPEPIERAFEILAGIVERLDALVNQSQ